MSSLPRSPLLEVIFEVRWVDDASQFWNGDIFPLLKEKYPTRELVNPGLQIPGIPSAKFKSLNNYPLVQVGNGLLTLNTIDDHYQWADFQDRAIFLLTNLDSLSPISQKKEFSLFLNYLDIIEFDFKNQDIVEFFSDFLHLKLNVDFRKSSNPKQINIALTFDEGSLGTFNINFNRGRNLRGAEGIMIHTALIGSMTDPTIPKIKGWMENAHQLTSKTFKDLTAGKLYESFK